jgi:hypothetical protein
VEKNRNSFTSNSSMKIFLIRVSIFVLLGLSAYSLFSLVVLPKILVAAFGISVKDQIDKAFTNALKQDYEILILGNSKIYCGINPDKFDRPAYNLAHNNDTYNQMYYKLKYLIDAKKKIRYLIVGTDYFQFGFVSDTRNYAYAKWLGPDYLRDYKNSNYQLKESIQFLKPHRLRRLLRYPYEKNSLKDNGQFVRLGEASEDDFQRRHFKFDSLQVHYFERLLDLANQEGIKVYIVMPPMRMVELSQYTEEQVDEFDKFMNRHLSDSIKYLDFSIRHPFADQNFIDMAHLSQEAADEFSMAIDKELN